MRERRPVRPRIPQALSTGEEAFALCLKVRPEIPPAVRQHLFHPERGWRFDFAWPEHQLAVEIDGASWSGGRHTRGRGFLDDLEKLNTGSMLGWRVLRFVTAQARSCEAAVWVEEFFRTTREAERLIVEASR